MTEHRVQMSDGASLFVKLFDGDSTTKPLLIALHGAPGLSSHLEPEASYSFLQSSLRVLIFDARGSGVSDLTPPYTHERWIADIEELRTWANAARIILAGGSYGGFIAQDYALAHPTRLHALILRDTWPWGTAGMMQALKACVTSPGVRVDPERQYRMWTGLLQSDDDFARGVAEMSALFAPPSPSSSSSSTPAPNATTPPPQENTPRPNLAHSATQNFAFSHNMPRFDVRSRLHEINVPTLVLCGRHDVITPLEFSEEIARGIPGAELVVFEASGHNPAQDEGEKFREVVGAFVGGLDLGL